MNTHEHTSHAFEMSLPNVLVGATVSALVVSEVEPVYLLRRQSPLLP